MKVLVLDNSVATTGAFLSAMAMADTLRDEVDFLFVLPTGSICHATAREANYASLAMPMVEIGKSAARVAAYLPMLLLNGWRLRRILADQRIDLLVANDYFNQLPLISRIMGWKGPTITVVRLLPDSQMPMLNRLWLRSMKFATTATLAVSRAVMRQLPVGLKPHLVYFPVGRGIEEAEFVPPVPRIGCRFLYLANYIRGKGQDEVVEAFARVREQASTAALKLVGGDMGLAKNRQFRAELEARVARLGISDCVTFAGPTSDVIEEIRAADVVLNFSRAESYSHTCVEAGHLGRPVVATRCGGPEEVIVDGETGFLVPLNDVDAAALAMTRLALDQGLRHSCGGKAFALAKRRFGAAQFHQQMLSIFHENVSWRAR